LREARWKKREEKEERGKGTWEEGNSPTPESCSSRDEIRAVSRLSSPWRQDKSCQIQDILKPCGYW